MAQGMTVRLDTRDVDAAREQLARSYCPHRLDPRSGGTGFRARQIEGGNAELGIYSLSYGADPVRVTPVPFGDFVLVSRPVAGRLGVRGGGREIDVGPGAVVALDPRSEHRLDFGPGCRLMTVKLPCAVLDRVAAASGRSADIGTGAPADTRGWDAVTRFLLREVLPYGLLDSPLGGGVAELAALAALDAFGTSGEPKGERAGPAMLRRACAFVEDNAHAPIGLLDIAAAAGVRPRTLQEHFRDRMGMTPTAYLRDVRLHRVRADLLAGAVATVAEAAQRWGFGNLGRFAADYRRAFGRPPSRDLRRG
jgi:AraC-like DNA-binding protein